MEYPEYDNFSATLSWNDLTVSTVPTRVQNSRCILKNSNGAVRPGEFLAVMGPSGAGKTTLLSCLAKRRQNSLIINSGQILLNNNNIETVAYSSLIGFVPQDDVLFTCMTPREILYFSARLTQKLSRVQIKELVNRTIEDLGLESCANSLVGGGLIRGISGGEKKRTSIGMELICNPSVLFLDEPTTGLDSWIALNIVQLIVKIAKKYQRTVIATIHQPSSQIFKFFDKLLLLSQGETVYIGKASNSIKYFNSIGYQLPENYNPADHFLSVISENSSKIPSVLHNPSIIEVEQSFTRQRYSLNFISMLLLLVWRAYLEQLRNPLNLAAKIVKLIAFSLMMNAVFWKLGYDNQGIYDRESCIFVLICSLEVEAHLSVVQTFQMQKAVFLREYAQDRYSVSSYFLSHSIITMPIEIIWDILFVLIVYYSLDLNTNNTGNFLLISVLTGMTGTGWGMLVSITASTLESAVILSMGALIPLWLCGGFLVNYSDIPSWFFFKWASPFYFTFQAAARSQLENLYKNQNYADIAISNLNLPCSFNESVLYTIISIILFRLLDFLLLKYIYKFN
jgi:ABC-type multidrug transport system ATPase subunit